MMETLKKLFFVFLCCLLIESTVTAQDIHSSDFYTTVINLNPALTGDFQGNRRYIAAYRWQYGTVTIPFQTITASCDFKKTNRKTHHIGFGILLNYDKTGDSRFTSIQFGIPFAFHQLSHSKKQLYSFGLLPQIIYNSIDYSNLQFGDQFITDHFYETVKTKDILANNSINYFNLTTGINGTFIITKESIGRIGFAIGNVTSPEISFDANKTSILTRRYCLHGTYQYRIGNWTDVVPSVKFQYQGAHREFQYGGKLMYYLDNRTIPMINIGCWYRSRDRDALILNAGMNINNYIVGINYDINMSGLSKVSYGQGALEFTLVYIYNKSRMPHKFESIKCPTHL